MKSFLIYFGFLIVAWLVCQATFPIAYWLGVWGIPNGVLGLAADEFQHQIETLIAMSDKVWLLLVIGGHLSYIKLANKSRKHSIAMSMLFIALVVSVFGYMLPKITNIWWLYVLMYFLYILVALIIPYEVDNYFKRKKMNQLNVVANFK